MSFSKDAETMYYQLVLVYLTSIRTIPYLFNFQPIERQYYIKLVQLSFPNDHK